MEQLYRRLLAFTRDGVYRYAFEDGTILMANQGLVDILDLGCTPDEIVGRRLSDVLTYTQRQGVVRQELSEKGEIHGFEYHFKTLKGEDKWVIHDSFMVTGAEGQGPIVEAIVKDITYRKRAEDQLRREKELLDTTLRSIVDGVITTDVEGRVRLMNPVAEALTGWKEGEAVGQPLDVVFRPVDGATSLPLPSLLPEIVGGGTPRSLGENTVLVGRHGTEHHVADSAAPVRHHDGAIVGVVIVFRDVTAQKRAERQQRQLVARMLQVQKVESLGVLAGGIAHDFNNLLVAMLGNADLVLSELPREAATRGRIEEISRAALRATDLCRQLLEYAGRGRSAPGPVSLNAIVEDITRLLQVTVSRKATLAFELDRTIPAVIADPTQLRQVVMNLITNSSEAIGDQKGTITVSTGTVTCDREYLCQVLVHEQLAEGPYVFLDVEDTGCGMDAETQKRIFDPFFTSKFAGRGLGLATVLGIVRSHRGAIRVYSEPGRGTRIRVLLPPTSAAVDEEEATPRGDVDVERRGTVLVVDDDEIVLAVARRMLERAGYDVLVARDGLEAVEVCQTHAEISCVLLDVAMPRLDGEEALRGLAEIRPSLPVVLSSGYDGNHVAAQMTGQAYAGFVPKPYKARDLLQGIASAIQRASTTDSERR